MIFVTLGSQKFQFNRLLKAIDDLIEQNIIQEEVFAQIGYSDYLPTNFKYKQFLDRDEFSQWQEQADIVITHGGTGAIIGALKKGKKVIAVPRLAKYKEHVDNHQLEIISIFTSTNYIFTCSDFDKLPDVLNDVYTKESNKFESNSKIFLNSIKDNINASSNRNENLMTDFISKLLYMMFIILPFLDNINGYLVRNFNISYGTIYHAVFTLILLIISRINILKLIKRFSLFGILLSISIVGNYFLNPNYIINFSWVFKFVSFALNVNIVNELISNRNRYTEFKKIIRFSSILIPSIIICLKILNIGNTSYLGKLNGFIGGYSSSNELNIILLSLLGMRLLYSAKKFVFSDAISIFLLVITLLLIESKSSIILTCLLLVSFFIQILNSKKIRINKKVLIAIPVTISGIAFLLKDQFLNLFKRQSYLFDYFYKMSGGNIFVYLTSGRLLRINQIFDYVNFTTEFTIFKSIFMLIFGNGYLNVGDIAIEMEVFDSLQWFGLCGVFMILAIYTYYFVSALKTKNSPAIMTTLCIIAFSFTAGHVIYGGVAGIYIAIVLCVISNYMRYEGDKNAS